MARVRGPGAGATRGFNISSHPKLVLEPGRACAIFIYEKGLQYLLRYAQGCLAAIGSTRKACTLGGVVIGTRTNLQINYYTIARVIV